MADSSEEINLSALSMPDLLAELKRRKTALLTHQLIIGFVAGVAVFSVVNNGFRLVSLGLPVIILFFFARNGKGLKASLQSAQAEVKARNEQTSA